jgi:uncharacterized membrane protein
VRTLRSAAAVALLCAYAVLSHVAVTTGRSDFAAAAWICLIVPIALALPWKVGVPIAAALLAPLAWVPTDTLLKAPPVVIYFALATWFGRTLLPGRQPLISGFASLERGELEPELARYTRRLTALWSAFFVFMAVVSAALALLADAGRWSFFTNGVNYVLMALLFVGEYVYRRVRYRHYRHASFPRMMRMLFTASRARNRAEGR